MFGGGGRKMETEDEELGPELFEIYRKDWLMMWGRNGARSFEAESTYVHLSCIALLAFPLV